MTGDYDGAVRFWQTETGEEILRLQSNPAGAWAVVTPDGRWDASDEGRDLGIIVWSGSNPKRLADYPKRRVPGLLAQTMKPFVEVSKSSWPPNGSSEPANPTHPPGHR